LTLQQRRKLEVWEEEAAFWHALRQQHLAAKQAYAAAHPQQQQQQQQGSHQATPDPAAEWEAVTSGNLQSLFTYERVLVDCLMGSRGLVKAPGRAAGGLASAYQEVLGGGVEAAWTSCHGRFMGTLDYVMYTPAAGEWVGGVTGWAGLGGRGGNAACSCEG
jgi:hypothetical protein